jgi:Zn-dependent protease
LTFIARLLALIARLLALIIGIDVHEFAHAWTANELGDPTAKYMGRLSLNPLVHFDPIGALLILYSMLTGFGFGWGKPVPVNPYNLRKGPRVGMGIVAAAGPISNLVIASIASFPIRLGLPLPRLLYVLLSEIVNINIRLAVFNLLPIFPLDGFSVLRGILGTIRAPWAYQWSDFLDRMQAQGPFIFFLLILIDQILYQILRFSVLWAILEPFYNLFYRLLLGF